MDAQLINDPFVRMLAASAGVRTRTGPAELMVKGTLSDDGSPLDIRIGRGLFEAQFEIPVVLDTQGKPIEVRRLVGAPSPKFDKVKSSLEAKGAQFSEIAIDKQEHELSFRLSLNRFAACQGIAKIAYLFSAWLLGDSFVESKAGVIYRSMISLKGIGATDSLLLLAEKAREANAEVIADERVAHSLFPCEAHEHLLICHAKNGWLMTIVKLFGCEELTYGFGLPISDLDVPPFLEVIRVDAFRKAMKRMTD